MAPLAVHRARDHARRARERAAWRSYHVLRRVARRAGYHLVRANYYSPIADLATLPAAVFDEPAHMPGLPLDLDAQLAFLRDELGPYLAEFRPPREAPGNDVGYFADNAMYGLGDAAILYALLRARKPRRILEIGAGFSTLVAATATARNAAEGAPVDHQVVDPHPSPVLPRVADRITLRKLGANDLPLSEFAALQAGDVLFVDTTHTVRPANDVLYLLLEAVPAIAPGVLVHVHDIFRPYEYPRILLDQFGVSWQEHYLLQALLQFNDRFAVRVANHALFRERLDGLRALVPGIDTLSQAPSGFWFERV